MTNGLIQYVTKEKKAKMSKAAPKKVFPELKMSMTEARQRAELIMEFLRLTHPMNTKGGYVNAIEIKFLHRGEGLSTSLGDNYFNLYDLNSSKEEEKLAQRMFELSELPHCTYFSIYTYKQNVEVKVQTNKIGKDGNPVYEYKKLHHIVKENVGETQILAFDLDNATNEQYQSIKKFLNDLGIKFIGEFSGYGYQGYVLLKKPVSTKSALKEFTTRLIKLGLPVDGSIEDATRVMRVPFTTNSKQFSSMFKQYKPNDPRLIETKLVDTVTERYEYKEVLAILDAAIAEKESLSSPKKPLKDTKKEKAVEHTVIVKKEATIGRIEDMAYEKAYEFLTFAELPTQVQNMLRGAPTGVRNPSVLYLTQYFNNVLGLSPEKVEKTLITFNNLCPEPQPEEKVISDYRRISENYPGYKRGIYSQEMIKEFGYEDLDTEISEDIDYVLFDNTLIKEFNVMNHTSVQIYLSMKLMEIQDNKKEFTKEEIMNTVGISESTVKRNIKDLTKRSIVISEIKNKKRMYRLNIFGRYIEGFTKISRILVEDMLKKLEPTETALFIYLMYRVGSMKKAKLFVSQIKISQDMGLEQPAISKITDSLKEKNYIRKETKMTVQKRRKTNYILRVK